MNTTRRTTMRAIGSRHRFFWAVTVVGIVGALLGFTDSLALWVRPVEEPATTILQRVVEEEGLNRVTLTVDGSLAAASVIQQVKPLKYRSTIRFYSPDSDKPSELALSGYVRDLLFEPGGDSLFALRHVAGKKRPGDVELLRIDTSTLKIKRRLYLPPSAQALAYRPDGDTLLIVCAQEIRSVLLPDLRSGPLYRLLGVNTSATILDEGRLLVGREDGLALVDLRDPSGEDEMPVRFRIDSDRPIDQVAANRDGSAILARWSEGGIVRVDLRGRSLVTEGGDGVLPSRPWPPRASVPGSPAAAVTDSASAAAIDPEPATGSEVIEKAGSVDDPAAAPEPSAAAIGVAAEPVAAAPPAEALTVESAASEPEPASPAPLESAPVGDDAGPAPQIAGKLTGPGAGLASSIVLLGPDNILREATRVTPDENGRWEAVGLEPGRYRIQLAADGDQVLLSEPPFHVVEVPADRPTSDLEFRVLESR